MNDEDFVISLGLKVLQRLYPERLIRNDDFNEACSFMRLNKDDIKELKKILEKKGIIEVINHGHNAGIKIKRLVKKE